MKDPYSKISDKDKEMLFTSIENYINIFESTFIPDKKIVNVKRLRESIALAREVVRKGQSGKRNIFVSYDEWDDVIEDHYY